MKMFKDFGLSPQLFNTIKNLGFTKPTQIQELSIPPIIKGMDVIGESATGSGKTLAFGCGIIEKVKQNDGLQALILTPTRELAEQVKDELKKLSGGVLRTIAVYGGVAIGPQINNLTRAEVVVGTPGRLLDHLRRGTIRTSKIRVLVLDEVDRMLDMGFIEDVEDIVRACPTKRQTLFFSATIPPRISNLAKRYMVRPVRVAAQNQVDPRKLKQIYFDISRNEKMSLLIHLLQHEKSGLVMVFCNTRRTTDFVVRNLQTNNVNAIAIHGGLSQNKRTKTINLFHDARVSVLVCTDVAARGLHIDDVSHIYNYELPKDPNDYVHRIGRTARAGEEGKVINLLCDVDYNSFSKILDRYQTFKIERVEKPQLKKAIIKTDYGRHHGRPQRRPQPYRGRRR